ncbi:MAG: DUF21 domain-containing protein [Phycisphaeraceae bacterium]|nr:DUF21 domain-containing protein [Phycisphaeraceae bacterium]
MTIGEYILWWAIALIGFGGSCFFSGVETGYYTLSPVRLALRAADRNDHAARRLRRLADRPQQTLAALLIGNNLANYLAMLGFTALLESAGYSETAMILFNVIIITPTVIVFCESLPKEVFRRSADRTMYPLAAGIDLFRRVLTILGIIPALLLFTRLVARLIGASPEPALTHREEITRLLREGAHAGALSPAQRDLMDRAMALQNARVGHEMTPWKLVTVVPIDWDRPRLMRMIVRSTDEHYPVTDSRGRTVGILHQIDALLTPDGVPGTLVREVVRLHPADPVGEALRRLRASNASVAIVEHEGRPLGVVTLKDLVEPLVGELRDL